MNVNLSNCDREPIHTPGSIQPHGAMLVFDAGGGLRIRSANAEQVLGPLPVQGGLLEEGHLTEEARAAIRAAMPGTAASDLFEPVELNFEGRIFDLIAHHAGNLLIAEFEPRATEAPPLEIYAVKAQRAIQRIQRQTNLDEMLRIAVDEIRLLTGFDRVMAYRFRHDASGDVVAENKREDLPPYLGQRYPASDIPAQARRLYVLNPIRLIADVNYAPSQLQPALAPGETPLDLSHAVLRSVSPIHCEYLQNMGVAGSMSISIVVRGELWGLFACHHMSARLVPYAIRMACQLLSQVVSVLVERTEANDRVAAVAAVAQLRAEIVEQVKARDDIQTGLVGQACFTQLVDCMGGASTLDRRIEVSGMDIPHEALASLVAWLNASNVPDVYDTDQLCEDAPELACQLGGVCGLLAARFHGEQNGYVMWFRPEQVETVRWGGKPEKVLKTGPLGTRLTPRGSFETWSEEVRNRSVPWTDAEIEIARNLRRDLQSIALANAAKLDRARDLLMAALGHDLRDPLQAISMSGQILSLDTSAASSIGKRITSSTNRMQRMISQILDMSRIQSGLGLGLQLQSVDINVLLGELLQEAQTAHPGLQLQIEVTPLGEGQLDPDRFSQVVTNIVSNARHHGAAGMPVTITAVRDGEQLVFEVSNYGEPIPDAVVQRLFQPFKPESLNNKRNRTGLGIGLHIANEIVKGHGGELSVTQGEGRVTFCVRILAFAVE